jgi:AcrR family transcriptional regulator
MHSRTMPRHAVHDASRILDAASRLAASEGPARATIGRIAAELGAPTGSIYHRFASRDLLLGEVWLAAAERFQHDFGAVLSDGTPRAAALAAACFVPARVRERPDEARLLLLHRREDFFGPAWPEALAARARELQRGADAGLKAACRRLFGRADAATLRALRFAIVDVPLAAVLPHLRANEAPPATVDVLVRTSCEAVLDRLATGQAWPPLRVRR